MATLRQLRLQRHLTEAQLVVAAEVSPSTVDHSEAGTVWPRPALLQRRARVLAVRPGEIESAAHAFPADRQTAQRAD